MPVIEGIVVTKLCDSAGPVQGLSGAAIYNWPTTRGFSKQSLLRDHTTMHRHTLVTSWQPSNGRIRTRPLYPRFTTADPG
jgi:hypothetical protein